MTRNEFYFESQYRKIVEKMDMEKEERIETETKRKNNQLEVAAEGWINQFIKPEYRLTFMAILRFKLGQKLAKKGETMLECFGVAEELAAERIIVPEEADRLIFYLSALYILTNTTSAPIMGRPAAVADILGILKGDISKAMRIPSLYSVPPLRLCREQPGHKRKHYETDTA